MTFKKKVLLAIVVVLGGLLFWFGYRQPYDITAYTANIQKFYYYRDLQKIFDACDEHTLVTFDVDDTLIATTDLLPRTHSYPFWLTLRAIIRHPIIFLDREKFLHFFSMVCQQARHVVFDPDVVHMIKKLQLRGVPVIALTSMDTGALGVIPNMQERRAKMLKDFDIDFSGHFADVVFANLPVHRKNFPVLYKGILCTNHVRKGALLGAFLDHVHLAPRRIVSFDDQEWSLVAIAAECKKRGIDFKGYQVLGASLLPDTWSTQRALLQIDTIVRDGNWLSDDTADAILAGKSKPA